MSRIIQCDRCKREITDVPGDTVHEVSGHDLCFECWRGLMNYIDKYISGRKR